MEPQPGSGGPAARSWAIATLVVVAVAGLLVVVLVVTGIQLSRTYRPSAAQAWPGIVTLPTPAEHGRGLNLRAIHRDASALLGVVAVAGVITTIGWSVAARRRTWVAGLGLVALAGVGGSTGFLLPFDQLGLWAVTVGMDVSGIWVAAFSDSIRFILIDGSEVSQGQYRVAVAVHLAIGVASAVLVALLARAARRDVRPDRPSAPDPAGATVRP